MHRPLDHNFPPDFLWGASTASHQVEGGTVNQWSVWELETASERAKEPSQGIRSMPAWPHVQKQAHDPRNYVAANGVEHYQRYKLDFDILQKLNCNAFRFGIEWSRLEPLPGQWDKAVLTHYKTYIKELRKRGIEPFLNIWHWTNPIWFEEMGGFTKRKNLFYFERLVKKIAEELCEDVNYVLTINEANSYVTFGYLTGEWPPQQRSLIKAAQVYYNLTQAHKRAYTILKAHKPSLQVGAAHQATANLPNNPHNIVDPLMAKISNYFWHGWFYNRINKYQDFLGMNFYFAMYWSWFRQHNPKTPLNDLGWYMEPAAIGPLMVQLHKKYKKPIIITENGVADSNDEYRQWWLQQTMDAMERTIDAGVELKGYLHWSLLDNFEWAYGWWPKFGLVEVDRERGMTRRVRKSAIWWARTLKQIRKP